MGMCFPDWSFPRLTDCSRQVLHLTNAQPLAPSHFQVPNLPPRPSCMTSCRWSGLAIITPCSSGVPTYGAVKSRNILGDSATRNLFACGEPTIRDVPPPLRYAYAPIPIPPSARAPERSKQLATWHILYTVKQAKLQLESGIQAARQLVKRAANRQGREMCVRTKEPRWTPGNDQP